MGLIAKLRMYAGIMRQAKRPLESLRLMRQRPPLMFGAYAYELGLMVSSRVDARLKTLAQIKTSALVGCPA